MYLKSTILLWDVNSTWILVCFIVCKKNRRMVCFLKKLSELMNEIGEYIFVYPFI